MTYLFEASILDVELLGVNKVKQFAVFFPKGQENNGVRWIQGFKEVKFLCFQLF